MIGSNVTFSVVAVKSPPMTTNGLTYRWRVNTNYLKGKKFFMDVTNVLANVVTTNASLTITNVQLNKVGFYDVVVTGSATAVSAPAGLLAVVPFVGGITVYGTPESKSQSGPGCPGAYAGYVYYTNSSTAPCYGFMPIDRTTIATATDAQSTRTKVQYLGCIGDSNCHGNGTVSIPPTIPSTNYQFYIYFPSKPLPPPPYGISLTNFQL
jgi:hypothetical protein